VWKALEGDSVRGERIADRITGVFGSWRFTVVQTVIVTAWIALNLFGVAYGTSQGTGPPFYKIGKHNPWKRSEVMAWFDAHLDELSRSGR
jgi:hypothetical protein